MFALYKHFNVHHFLQEGVCAVDYTNTHKGTLVWPTEDKQKEKRKVHSRCHSPPNPHMTRNHGQRSTRSL